MQLVGANPNAQVVGLDPQAGTSNYFIGNDPTQWHSHVGNYGQVAYQDIYPGIGLVYYGNQRQLEYDFTIWAHSRTVAPRKALPSRIAAVSSSRPPAGGLP
jgi:hypothetical protein